MVRGHFCWSMFGLHLVKGHKGFFECIFKKFRPWTCDHGKMPSNMGQLLGPWCKQPLRYMWHVFQLRWFVQVQLSYGHSTYKCASFEVIHMINGFNLDTFIFFFSLFLLRISLSNTKPLYTTSLGLEWASRTLKGWSLGSPNRVR